MAISPFPRTGLHLDLRIQVMRPEALHRLASRLARSGFNTLLVEWEATFPFSRHPLITNRYGYTPQQVKAFIAHCQSLGIEVIPLQQCFGHVEYILQHERYAHLRESDRDLCQLCPCKADAALELFEDVFSEIIAAHPSEYLHIGGDETYLLGSCPECRKVVEKKGASALYVGYFKRVAELVVKLGKRPLIWADMLLKHPERAEAMPASSVFVDWNYGWAIDHFGDPQKLRKSRFEFWGAPALRSSPDNHSFINWPRHFNNLRDYIPYAKDSDFKGMIITSWSTSGVYGYNWEDNGCSLQMLPVRRVYPLGGTMILLDAFREATGCAVNGQALDAESFVRDYGVKHFGLEPRDAAGLWQALQVADNPLDPALDIEQAQANARKAAKALAKMAAKRNRKEFSHLQLIADLHLFRLNVRGVEKQVSATSFTVKQVPAVVRKLEKMLIEAKELDRRFIALNRSDFYTDELREDCEYRNSRLRGLYERLKGRG